VVDPDGEIVEFDYKQGQLDSFQGQPVHNTTKTPFSGNRSLSPITQSQDGAIDSKYQPAHNL